MLTIKNRMACELPANTPVFVDLSGEGPGMELAIVRIDDDGRAIARYVPVEPAARTAPVTE